MKAFVTGSTGFVGSHVAHVLARSGAELRLLVRSGSPTGNIDDLAAERIVGDLRDPESLRRGLEGCELAFHVAADYRLWVRRPEELYQSNVEGTRSLLMAARTAGVRRVIYTSSVATMGFPADGTPGDEESPVSLADMIGHYKRSKFMAEQVAIEAARAGQDVVVVNPTTPVGEGDIKPTPTGKIIVDFLNRRFPAYLDTGLNLVDVAEVARGHVLAAEKAQPGRRYILGGVNLTLKQLLDKLAALTGLRSPGVRLPYAVACAFGALDTLFTGMLFGREPRAPLEAVRMGRKRMFVSSRRAERELGWEIVPPDDALRRAVDWFHAHGYVRA
ncbi:MAG TPA: hopanoid-associated sugar epimerase [Terriglobales bacterium]|nr:hopanoid-associated sugar epimerase [Terriglobales bacterium]